MKCKVGDRVRKISNGKEYVVVRAGAGEGRVWVCHHFMCELIDLYSGTSKYNYALGTTVHETSIPEVIIENKEWAIEWMRKTLTMEWGKACYKMFENVFDGLVEVE